MGCGVSASRSSCGFPPAETNAASSAAAPTPAPAATATTPPPATLFTVCPTPRSGTARRLSRSSAAAATAAAATPNTDKNATAISKGDLVEVTETGVVARVSSVCLTFPVGLCRLIPVEDASVDQNQATPRSSVWRTSKLQRVPDLVFESESSPTGSSAAGSSTAGTPTNACASSPSSSHLSPVHHRLRSSLKATPLHPSSPPKRPLSSGDGAFPCHDPSLRWSIAPPVLAAEPPETLTFLPRRPCKQRAASAETSFARQERVVCGRNFHSLPQVPLFGGNRGFASDSPPCITLTPLS
eukprot:Rhum_TRINITY_DN15440_c6_g2::Rhum_TRINITY_DN15440_c6_g2_i1::g.157151::m.157151